MPYYPPIDYTSRDWLSVRNDMLEAAQSIYPEWVSRSTSDFGIVLLEAFAYGIDMLSFYGDRAASEAFLRTAVQRRSVLDIANQLGYIPAGAQPASTTLQFTVQPDVGEVLIPKCTRVATQGSQIVYFELDEDLVIDSDDLTVGTVEATEGQTFEMEAVGASDGTAGQRFTLMYRPVIAGSVRVYINEGGGLQQWREVETLLEGDTADAIYTIATDDLGRVVITFGDNITGRVPAQNSVIKATYRVGGGARGNVPAGTLTQVVNDVPGVTAVTNTSQASGGVDAESLASIRQNAPRAQRTAQRAVSLRDHADLALTRPRVAKALARVADDFTATNRHVEVFVAPHSATVLDAADLLEVETFIQDRAILGSNVDVYNAAYQPVKISATLYIADGYYANSVELAVTDALNLLLRYDRVDLAGRVALSQVYRAILSVAGVDYAEVTLLDAADDRNGGVVQDVVMEDDEVPVPGTITLTSDGGI